MLKLLDAKNNTLVSSRRELATDHNKAGLAFMLKFDDFYQTLKMKSPL